MIGLIEIRINTKSLIPGCGHLCSSLCASLNASPCLARAYSSVCLCVQVCLCSPMPSARSRCKCASADKEPAGSQRSANPVCATHTHTLKQCSRHYTVHWPLHNCYMYITHTHKILFLLEFYYISWSPPSKLLWKPWECSRWGRWCRSVIFRTNTSYPPFTIISIINIF